MRGGLEYGARLVVGFIINPMLVGGLGDYAFGVWQVLGRLIGYISPASGRPAQALRWTIANKQDSADGEEKRRITGNAIAIALLFLPLLVGFGAVLSWFAPIWFKAPAEYIGIVRMAAGILVLNVILLSLGELPLAVLDGENLGYKRMGLSVSLVLVGGGLTALAVYFDAGLVGVAAATGIVTLLRGALFLQIARRWVPWFGVAMPTLASVRGFMRLSGWFLLWSIVMRLMRVSDVVILGIMDSAELVTSYALTKYAPETIVTFISIVVFAITPGLGGIIGKGDLEKAARVRGEIMLYSWLLITVSGSTILLWNPSFVRLWVGESYDAGTIPMLLIVLMISQFVLIRNDAVVIDLSLDLRRKVLLGMLSTAVSLLLAAVLVGYFSFQIIGVCVGFIIGRLLLSVAYPWQVAKLLNVNVLSQLLSVVRPVLVTALLFAGAVLLTSRFAATTWTGLVAGGAGTFVVVLVVALYSGITHDQRDTLLARVRAVGSR